MRHAMDHRKLGRNPAHRKALLRNLMNALVRSERIETTVAKAKELRRLADRLITLGKRDTTHARRRVFSMLSDKGSTEKVFAGLAGRFAGREGGYTRIVRTGYRAGDGAELAIIEYLPKEEKKVAAKKTRRKGRPPTAKPAGKPAETKKAATVPRTKKAPGERPVGGKKGRQKAAETPE
jgi:large subunit ribosomal protein L17